MKSFSKMLAIGLCTAILAVFANLLIKPNYAMAATTPTTTSNPNCQNSNQAGVKECLASNNLVKDLNDIVNFLSAGVGIVVVGNIIIGGIQYTTSGEGSEGIKKARQRISNSALALVAFLFIYAFLQWIIPGGVFG